MFTRADLKAKAKLDLKGNYGVAIGAYIVMFLILCVSGAVPFVGGIVPLVLTGVIGVGYAIIYLNISRGVKPDFAQLFDGFKNFGTTCIAGILISIFTFLWSLLLFVPGIIKGLSYSMTFYILADHPEIRATDAIKLSQQMMDGHKMDLFILQISFIGWGILCGLTLGILSLYVVPYIMATTTNFYEAIKNEKNLFGINYSEAEIEETVDDIPQE